MLAAAVVCGERSLLMIQSVSPRWGQYKVCQLLLQLYWDLQLAPSCCCWGREQKRRVCQEGSTDGGYNNPPSGQP